jgi:hypothetical protein
MNFKNREKLKEAGSTYLEFKCSLELCKLAKEKGFKEPTNGSFIEYLTTQEHDNPAFQMTQGEVDYDTSYYLDSNDKSNKHYVSYACPNLLQLRRWLEISHKVHVNALLKSGNGKYSFEISYGVGMKNFSRSESSTFYNSFYKALNKGMIFALKRYVK